MGHGRGHSLVFGAAAVAVAVTVAGHRTGVGGRYDQRRIRLDVPKQSISGMSPMGR